MTQIKQLSGSSMSHNYQVITIKYNRREIAVGVEIYSRRHKYSMHPTIRSVQVQMHKDKLELPHATNKKYKKDEQHVGRGYEEKLKMKNKRKGSLKR